MITQELKKFMGKVAGDIMKISQTCTTAQENIGKLIENIISQALSKPQDSTPPNPTLDSKSSQTSNSSMKQTGPCPGQQLIMTCHSNQIMTHITYKVPMKHTLPHMLM